MKKEELAKWLHDNYEAVAKEKDWNTQQSCKVEFDALPDANKRTMIEIADRLLNLNLLRLHFVVGQSVSPNDAKPVLSAAALDKLATDIVNQLDDYARDYNPYEYGLPTYDDHLKKQIEIIKRLISSYI